MHATDDVHARGAAAGNYRGDVRCSGPVIGAGVTAPPDDALFQFLWGEPGSFNRACVVTVLKHLRALSEADAALARAMDEA